MSVNALTGEIGAPDCLGAAGCLGAANSLGAPGHPGAPDSSPDSSLSALTDSELLHTLEAAFARRHEIDAELVRLAGQVVERSRSSLGPAGLASRLGQTSPSAVLTDIGRIPSDEAFRLCRVGEATGTRMSLVGERMPPLYPALAEALAAGGIPVASANWIVSALSQVAPQAHPDELAEAERQLAAHAADRSADEIRKLATRFRDMLDVDGIEPREEALAQLCSLRRIVRHNGMKRYVIDLDPLGSAHLDASIDAAVTQAIRSVRFEGGEGPDACGDDRKQLPDPRTLTQIAAAAIVEIARHANSCTSTHVPVPSATIVVRMTLESLMSGLGEAHIDGIEQPISAGTARHGGWLRTPTSSRWCSAARARCSTWARPDGCSAGPSAWPSRNGTADARCAAATARPAIPRRITFSGGRTPSERISTTGYCSVRNTITGCIATAGESR